MGIYAVAALLNAFICCGFVSFFVKAFKFSSAKRLIITYVVYFFMAFAMCAGGNGIFDIDIQNFNLSLFVYYIVAGVCVCIGLYVFFERGSISEKIMRKREKKAGGKGRKKR